MSDMFLLSESQMERIRPFFPLAHGVPRVDDRRVLSGIVYVIRNGLQWKDAPKAYGPYKTLYNRFIRWSRLGIFDRIFVALTEQAAGQAGNHRSRRSLQTTQADRGAGLWNYQKHHGLQKVQPAWPCKSHD